MSYASDNHNAPTDVPFRPAGTGLQILASCMYCGQRRHQAGGRGRPGPRWKCAVCVSKEAKK